LRGQAVILPMDGSGVARRSEIQASRRHANVEQSATEQIKEKASRWDAFLLASVSKDSEVAPPSVRMIRYAELVSISHFFEACCNL